MGWRRSGTKKTNKEETPEEDLKPSIHPGQISSIERQRKNPNRVSIYINNKFAFGLHQDVLLQHSLHSGLHLEEPQILELIDADALLRAKEAAVQYLGYRARTEKEVRTKLRDKGFEAAIIEQVIARLHELSYLNDARFAENYTKSRFNSKGYGPQRIRTELRRLGISESLIENTFADLFNHDDLHETAKKEALKRLKRLRKESDLFKKKRKLFDFLMRRGYTSDVIKAVIDQVDLESEE